MAIGVTCTWGEKALSSLNLLCKAAGTEHQELFLTLNLKLTNTIFSFKNFPEIRKNKTRTKDKTDNEGGQETNI